VIIVAAVGYVGTGIGFILAIRQQTAEAKAAAAAATLTAEDLCKDLRAFERRFEDHEIALRKRLEDDRETILTLRLTQAQHAKDLERSMGQVLSAISDLTASIRTDLRGIHARVDQILKREPKA
jgi:hypothetical protein